MHSGIPVKIWAINFGLLVATALFAHGCSKQETTTPPSRPLPFQPPLPAPPLRYLALGDSYTIGQGVSTQDRFPHQTVAITGNFGRQFAEPEYIATTGWTTANLLTAIQNASKPKNFDIVSLLIGVNNQYQRRDTAEYRTQFTQCLLEAITHAGGRKTRVFVLSIPDYGVTPFGKNLNPVKIAEEIDAFNRINLEVSVAMGVNYIEITQGSRDALNDLSLVAGDGLHPSGKEYRKWAEKLSAQVLIALR